MLSVLLCINESTIYTVYEMKFYVKKKKKKKKKVFQEIVVIHFYLIYIIHAWKALNAKNVINLELKALC